MTLEISIRDETAADAKAITDVTVAAFSPLDISSQTEQFVIVALRNAGALTLSLVAELQGQIIGHIAFSPVQISDGSGGWYGLGPVSVLPKFQRQGVGKALIKAGLKRLQDLNAQGCCLVGHPDYYKTFGFINVPELVYEGVPAEVFFVLLMHGDMPRGQVTFHEAFNATS